MQNKRPSQAMYQQADPLPGGEVLPLPGEATSLEQAMQHLNSHGMCLIADVLDAHEVEFYGRKLWAQHQAELSLEQMLPDRGPSNKIVIPNLVNKGGYYLDLVERQETEALAGYLLGKNYLLSSLTGHMFIGQTAGSELVHRDQGQIPASVEFPAICNLFYLLDDFTPARGSTIVFPGSHRWPLEHRIHPPPAEDGIQITAKAGSLFMFDGRLWHATGASHEGHRRQALSVFCCAPWVRQQEVALVSCSQDVFETASDNLKGRLGLKTYGTLGNINGTRVPSQRVAFGNTDIGFPDHLIGENAELIPLAKTRHPTDSGANG